MADDYAGDETTTGRLPTNGIARGHIDSATDEDWFRMDLQPGGAYLFTATASDGTEPMVYVYGKAGLPYVMFTNDRAYLNGNALSTPYSWVDEDQFYLWVQSDHPVDYTVGVRQLADDHLNNESAAIPITVGTNIGAQIDYSGDEEYFRIAATIGSTYHIRLTADNGMLPYGAALKIAGQYGWGDVSYTTEGDTVVMKLKATGNQDYYFKVDTDPREVLAAPVKYHVAMTGNAIVLPPDDHADTVMLPLPLEGWATARLDYAGDSEHFTFAARAGVTYTIRVAGDGVTLPYDVGLWQATYDPYMPYTTSTWEGTTKVLKLTPQTDREIEVGVSMALDAALSAPLPYRVSLTAADTAAPRATEAAGTVDGPLTLGFNEAVQRGSGTIELRHAYGSVIQTWDAHDQAVVVNGSGVSFDPGHALRPGDYELRVVGGALTDLNGNAVDPVFDDMRFHVSTTADGGAVVYPGKSPYGGIGPKGTGVLDGRIEDYTVTRQGTETVVTNSAQSFTYLNAERLMFTQSDDVIVLAPSVADSQVWRLYRAAFDRAPDKGGLGYWLSQQDEGMSLQTIALNFLASEEFTALYGANVSNADFVASLYQNVLDRGGDEAGLAYHIGNLERGAWRADVLTAFSESEENQATVAALIGNGFTYTSYI